MNKERPRQQDSLNSVSGSPFVERIRKYFATFCYHRTHAHTRGMLLLLLLLLPDLSLSLCCGFRPQLPVNFADLDLLSVWRWPFEEEQNCIFVRDETRA